MLFLATHTLVIDSLAGTLHVFTRAISPIDYLSTTILLPNSVTPSLSSSFHSSSQFTPHPIIFITIFNTPPLLLHYIPFWLNISYSLTLYKASAISASTVFISIDSYSFAFVLFKPFLYHHLLIEISIIVPSLCWALFLLFTVKFTRHLSLSWYRRINLC